jgi:hypothetical protein
MTFGKQKPSPATSQPGANRGWRGPLPVLGPDPDAYDTLVADRPAKLRRLDEGLRQMEAAEGRRYAGLRADYEKAWAFDRIRKELEAKGSKERE